MLRRWWGNPLPWLAISAVFLLLGIFVAPHSFPGVVVFIPFVWTGRPRASSERGGNGAR